MNQNIQSHWTHPANIIMLSPRTLRHVGEWWMGTTEAYAKAFTPHTPKINPQTRLCDHCTDSYNNYFDRFKAVEICTWSTLLTLLSAMTSNLIEKYPNNEFAGLELLTVVLQTRLIQFMFEVAIILLCPFTCWSYVLLMRAARATDFDSSPNFNAQSNDPNIHNVHQN